MSVWYLSFAMIILLSTMVGLLRILLGPTRADRMLAAQLFGTASVAIFLLLGQAFKELFLYDMALVFAMLGAVAVITFVRLIALKK
ncbi:Na(+) H(+) antiporter subunit F [hydrothermal vent metagenome]|uniref:Na(+) H(+) antiporter subunit F n=1 Tax=hydrothermal vent metagenome TaxID=652676 RepID=A0A3B1E5M1_9ZZZZ